MESNITTAIFLKSPVISVRYGVFPVRLLKLERNEKKLYAIREKGLLINVVR